MPWNGSGTFNRIYSWVADKAAGLNISSSRMDTDTNDIVSSGFGNCLTRDGQGQPTANLPMAGFRHTGVASGVARTDYSTLSQAQDGLIGWTVAGGTADAITATYTPSRGAPSDGAMYSFRATAANATTTPTFAPDSQTARTITRFGGAALQAGDIAGNLAEVILRYNSANTRYELLNPAQPINAALTFNGATTFKSKSNWTNTDEIDIPSGTTGQRAGSPGTGAIRFNSTLVAFEGYDGTGWRLLNSPSGGAAQISQLTSSSGTYTTPTGALYLLIEMIGGGGGGAGNGTGALNAGNGGTTTFNSINANGGNGGTAATTTNGQPGGSGGSGGTGTAAFRVVGGAGGPGGNASASVSPAGGTGGNGFFGGAGAAGTTTINPGAGQSSTGGGGGGAGSPNSSFGGAGGGGSGEYARFVIASPSATYSYAVGAAGTAGAGGTGGASGSNGGTGVIIVTAYFQ